MTSWQIMRDLDRAISQEMMKENGWKRIPAEARETLVEPEHVLKTWSASSRSVIATNRRLFVKQGHFSRRVAEIPYGSIAYIEHSRRYPWKYLLAGLLPALVILLTPLWQLILKETFISAAQNSWNFITQSISAFVSPQMFLLLVAVVPFVIGAGTFLYEARAGFNLYMVGVKPVYLPRRLGEVITFVRSHQDEQQSIGTKLKDIEK